MDQSPSGPSGIRFLDNVGGSNKKQTLSWGKVRELAAACMQRPTQHAPRKTREPEYPSKPFDSQAAAAAWVQRFVDWYDDRHCHSAIGFVTPNQRHAGLDVDILAARKQVYEAARAKHPQRWSRHCRTWQRTEQVLLNPRQQRAEAAVA